MSRRRAAARPGAGTRVGGGRLRVDAARAVHKLRDHQLADPAMWALEAVRAAAASSASEVHLDGDADDVWVGWSGAPLDRDDLPRLLDELVSPQASDDRRALRLLATAINTALGLGPRWVDVYAIDEDVTARVRYVPELLRATGDGPAEGLRSLTAADAPLPPGAPAITRGNVVHLRRFPALAALSLLATGQEPPELRLARRACEDLHLPLRIARGALARPHAATDLLRVRLDPSVTGEDRDAFLAIVDPSVARAEPWIDFAELGVVLATVPLALEIPFASGSRIPIRARIDAPRLPTNASRSGVRRDERWIETLERHLRERLGDLVTCLLRELGPSPEGSWAPERRARLRAAAIQLAAAWCGGESWRERAIGRNVSIPKLLAPLFVAPLARDAIGRERSIRELARGGTEVAHTGATPVAADLEPWLGGVPWIPPGDPLALLWAGARVPSARTLIAIAESGRAARARWLAKPIVPTTIAPSAAHFVVVPLVAPGTSARSCVPESLMKRPGLAGEVALSSAAASAARIDLVIDGRVTESLRLSAVLPHDAIVTASDLKLAPDHSRVAADDARAGALAAVDAAIVIGCEAAARRLIGRSAPEGETVRWCEDATEPPDVARDARLVRTGIRLAVRLLQGGEKEGQGVVALLASKSPLLDAAAWPTMTGEHRSFSDLLQIARTPGGAIGYVLRRPHPALAPSEDRPILLLDSLERDLLALLLCDLPLIDYGPYPGAPSAASLALGLHPRSIALMEIDAKDHRGVFGWWDRPSSVELTHFGRAVDEGPSPKLSAHPYVLRVDDDRIVPGRGGPPRFLPDGEPYGDVSELENRLACAIADATLGQRPAGLHLHPLETTPLRALLRACNDLRPSAANALGSRRIQALREAPLFPRAGTRVPGSVVGLARDFGGEIVFLTPDAAGFVAIGLEDWQPLVADERVAAGLGRLFQLRVRNGAPELELRMAQIRRDERLASHRRRPERRLELRQSDIAVRLTGDGFRGLLGLDRRAPPRTQLDVLLELRFLEMRIEPLSHLCAVVDVDAALVGPDVDTLTDTAIGRVRGALREGSAEIALRLAERTTTALARDHAACRFVREWLADVGTGKRRAAATRAIAQLRSAKIFETVQEGLASIDDATRDGHVHVGAPVEHWLGRAEGEPESELDAPILALPAADDASIADVIRAIAPRELRDQSARARRLQATRRVRWGLAERPRVSDVREPRFRWPLEDLAAIAPASERDAFDLLGLGEIALTGQAQTRVELFVSGLRDSTFALELRPGVSIACEPTAHDAARADLVSAVRDVLARTIRHVVDSVPADELPGWVRRALRESALLGGRTHLDAIREVPIFQATDDRWLSTAELDAQVARFGNLWITSDVTSTAMPLDPERVAIRSPRDEAAMIAGAFPVQDADDELRLDAIARRNRDRPKVDAIGPSAGDRDRALAIERVPPAARGARELIVLPLHPAHVRGRAMHAFRDRLPLGTPADLCAWPALSWVDDPRFAPDRTWSEPVDDDVLRDARQAVSAACERALDAAFAIPDDALAAVRVDRTFSSQAFSGRRDVQVRGVLWIEARRGPEVEVTDALGTTTRALTTSRGARGGMELPLGGRLVITGVAGSGAESALTSIGTHGYERMMRSVASALREGTSAIPDLGLAELVRAAGLGHVDESDPAAGLPLPCVDGEGATVLRLLRAMRGREPALLVPPARREHARALEWKGIVLIEDGSLAASRAIVALGDRIVPLERALADRILDLDEAAPDATGLAPAPTAASPPPAPAPTAARARAAERAPGAIDAPSATVHAVLSCIDALVRTAGLARGRAPVVRVDPFASSPLATIDGAGAVELAARHPVIRALAATDHPEALAILTAHVLGTSVRGNDDAATDEAHAILAILTAR